MRLKTLFAVSLLAAAATFAQAASVFVAKGTPVTLRFDQDVSSKTIKVGDSVAFHVARPVVVNGYTILKKGTPVTGIVSHVVGRKRYGINAQLQISINPVRSAYGTLLSLEPRQKGNVVGGKTGEAAAATVGGAIILGPVGLIGGYFIPGKEVNIKSGAKLETQVSRDAHVPTRG